MESAWWRKKVDDADSVDGAAPHCPEFVLLLSDNLPAFPVPTGNDLTAGGAVITIAPF